MSDPPTSIQTGYGELEVLFATDDRVRDLASQWPLPIATLLPRADAFDDRNERATFVLPFAHEGDHVNMIYIAEAPQPMLLAEKRARTARRFSARIVAACLEAGYTGLVLPAATLRDCGPVGVPGLALVVGPPRDPNEPNPLAIAQGVIAAAIDDGLLFEPVSKPDFVPPEVAGELLLDFAVLDGLPYCFRMRLDLDDPGLERLVQAGAKQLVHMPVSATAFPRLGERVHPPPAIPLLDSEPEQATVKATEEKEIPAAITPNGARRIYRVLTHLAACDGEVDESEREILDTFLARFAIPTDEARALEEEGRKGEGLIVGKNPVERELLLELMIGVSAADGVLHRSEEKRLRTFAKRFGVPREELRRRVQARFGSHASQVGEGPPKHEPSPGALRRIYRLLWYLAGSDGDVGDEEESLLEAFRVRCGIFPSEAMTLRNEGLRGTNLKVGKSARERSLLLDQLVAIATADDLITPTELRRLRKFTKMLGVPANELEGRLREHVKEYAKSQEPIAAAAAAAHSETAPASLDGQPGAGEDTLPTQVETDSARVLLLDIPKQLVGLNLIQVAVEGGFRGFQGVPAGVHRFSVMGVEREASEWVRTHPGQVTVLAFDGDELSLLHGERAEKMRQLAKAGSMDGHLQPFAHHLPWRALAWPLSEAPFPPPIHPVPNPPPPSRIEHALLVTHRGEVPQLLAELAYAFLRSVLGDDPRSLERWTYLVQAIYHCGESFPKEYPDLFVRVVDLLIEQQRQLPHELLVRDAPCTFGSRYLSEDLIDSEVPALVEAGRRWSVFIAGHHPGAPKPAALPQSLAQPTQLAPDQPLTVSLTENAAEIEQVERLEGRFAEALLPLLSFRSNIQEIAHDALGAVVTQERLVEVGEKCGTHPGLLSKGYGRLARLYREVGRAEDAAAAEREARRLAINATQLN